MKFNLTNEQKKIPYTRVLNSVEAELIARLALMNIEPSEFDEDSFVADQSSSNEKDIEKMLQKIKELNIIINNL